MVRFFVTPDVFMSDAPALFDDNAAHAKVLRLKPGEQVLLCDGQGREALCEVTELNSTCLLLSVLERRESGTEPAVSVAVYMAMPKADKLEHVIQKAVELGANEIVTFPTARCISKPDEKSLSKKLDRWQKIAASASEQCGRGVIPAVRVLASYKEALAQAATADMALLFYENERATTLQQTLNSKSYHTVSLLSGPEGGFEAWEVEQAMDAGLTVCTLGSRILRCETAPLCALSAVMFHSGEF